MQRQLLSVAGRAAQDLGSAALFGGNLFGRLALHPAVTELPDPRDRGRVVTAAWRRYGTVNSLGLAAVIGGWAFERAGDARPDRLSVRQRILARAKDGAIAATAVTGLASGLEGMRYARSVPHGAVPLEDGATPSPQAPPDAARLKRRLDTLGAAHLAAAATLITVNAALEQAEHRRPALLGRFGRRVLRRAVRQALRRR
jgi:hypothetical protein